MTPEYYQKKIKRLEGKNKKLRGSLHKINYEIVGLLQDVFSIMDGHEDSHSNRVAFYSIIIARKLRELYPGITANITRDAVCFHDLGKIGIPHEILLKPSELTDEEFQKIKKHTIIGSKIVGRIKSFQNNLDVIKFHHERWDGEGYPLGLEGEKIPLSARILAVADAFDAMTSQRPYRDKMSPEEAKEEILANSGTQFDPRIVEAFLAAWDEILIRCNN
ncbi:MAG: HD-GYP domain-containing protein [Armatimonadota bacterium]